MENLLLVFLVTDVFSMSLTAANQVAYAGWKGAFVSADRLHVIAQIITVGH